MTGVNKIKATKDKSTKEKLRFNSPPDVWSEISQYFKPKDFGLGWAALDVRLLFVLYRLRQTVQKPFIIHSALASTGHSDNSLHYKGKAVDFHVKDIPFSEAYEIISNFAPIIGGVGYYPYWNRPGFHIDIGTPREWWRDSEGKYRSLGNINSKNNFENLIALKKAIGEIKK